MTKKLRRWQDVERHLSIIFSNAVRSNYAFTIFDAILSTRDKLSALDDILQQELLGDPILSAWVALRRKLERMSRRRNKIVHAYTLFAPKPGDEMELPADPKDGTFEFLAGPGISKLPLLLDPIARLKACRNVQQLKQLATAFELLNERVGAFNDLMRRRHNRLNPTQKVPIPGYE